MSMSLKKEYLVKYKTESHTCFIESGTYTGGAVELASDLGFNKIISVEISERNYRIAFEKFKYNSKVYLVLGDSSFEFPKICSDLVTPSVFWLDGHFDKHCDTKGFLECPLLKELDSIKLSIYKEHIIMIDDLRLFGNTHETLWAKDLNLDLVKSKLLEINPNYKFYYENGWSNDDILVATVL